MGKRRGKKRKENTRMEWCLYNDGNKSIKLNVNNIEPDQYKEKYKGKLTCINGCEARIKLINSKKGPILGTWNKEGIKHNTDIQCPYHIMYKGVRGRKKLIEKTNSVKIPEDKVAESLKRKYENLLIKFNEKDLDSKQKYTNKIEDLGDQTVNTKKTDETGNSKKEVSGSRINYIDSEIINDSYVDLIKGVIGEIDNVHIQTEEEEKERGFYTYINLLGSSGNSKTHVYFPPAYYEGDEYQLINLKRLIRIINKENENKRMIVTCYGQIRPKDLENEFNVNIINPKFIRINGMSVNEILSQGSISNLPEGIELI